jgi:hypothetical protein
MARIPTDSITKRRLAISQMRRAILLLEEGDFVCALTLAGAAEEILGKMVARKGRSTAIKDFAERDRQLWEWAASKEPRLKIPTQTQFLRGLNRLRNEFKHNEAGKNSRVLGPFEYEAEEMLFRCIRNYVKLYGRPPREKIISTWWECVSL